MLLQQSVRRSTTTLMSGKGDKVFLSFVYLTCSAAGIAKRNLGTLISTKELATSLDAVKLLDGSWHMPNTNRDPYQEYIQQHIPGARFFGIDEIKDTTVDLPHMLPAPDAFAAAVGKCSIWLSLYIHQSLIHDKENWELAIKIMLSSMIPLGCFRLLVYTGPSRYAFA